MRVLSEILTYRLTLLRRTEWPHAPGLWNKDQVAGWKKVTDAVHKEGAPIFAQLWHRECGYHDIRSLEADL